MGTDLIVDDKGTEEQLARIMTVASQCSAPALRGMDEASKTFRIARATMELDKAMSSQQVMAMFKSLAGSELGFGADDIKKYDDKQIRRAAIVSLMKGARLTSFDGPEWMLLAGKCYLCKPFYRRILEEMEGITNVVVRTARHEQPDTSTAYVPVCVELRDNGRLRRWEFQNKDGQDCRIAVRINAGMIVDAILGKAEAKALRRVYHELAGEDISDEEPAVGFLDARTAKPSPPQSDTPTIPAQEQERVEAIHQMLKTCETIQEVNNTIKSCRKGLSDAATCALDGYAEGRREQIRSQRGERSNHKEN